MHWLHTDPLRHSYQCPDEQPGIQDGVNATENGDTVLVQPGTSDDSYSGFMEDSSGTFDGTSWRAPLAGLRKYYYSIALN